MRLRHSFLLFLAISCPGLCAEHEVTIALVAGEKNRTRGPFSVTVDPRALPQTKGTALAWVDRNPDSEAPPIPAQLLPGDHTEIVWVLPEDLKAGETRDLVLRETPAAPDAVFPAGIRCSETDAEIVLSHGDRTILRYRKQPSKQAAENDPIYTRTGYIHPLVTPGGLAVTGDYPADHPHQHALFQAWTKTRFEGREVNFWDQVRGKGRISYQETNDSVSGPVFGQFTVTHLHEDFSDPKNPKPVLEETWTVRAFAPHEDYFLVDIVSTQRCATESPLEIQRYHYGGMAIRGPDAWFHPDKEVEPPGKFLTSEGQGRIEGNHSRPRWVSMHGSLEGRDAGATVFSHPRNFRFPQWVRLHPNKPYFVFTPQVEEPFSLLPESEFVSRYRYVIQDSSPDPRQLERIWQDYAHPPVTLSVEF